MRKLLIWRANKKLYEENQGTDFEERLEKNGQMGVVLLHTCPLKHEPIGVFIHGIDQSTVDKSTEKWLDLNVTRLKYDEWYCGHFHTTKQVEKLVLSIRISVCSHSADKCS